MLWKKHFINYTVYDSFGSFILSENNECHFEVYALAADVDYVPQI